MSFRYFAYGSNLWLPQLRSRCPSARVIGPATLSGWSVVCDKPSMDGSTKFNIRPTPEGHAEGVVYDVDEGERRALDDSEPLYTPTMVEIDGQPTLTYVYRGDPARSPPYDWYLATTGLGAASHGLEGARTRLGASPDPIAPGIRPGTRDDLPLIQDILSHGLSSGGDRYYIHPGDYAWWLYHDDPRYPDHFSTWIQDSSGFVTVDSVSPHEVNVFARPGLARMPLIRWAQRRLDGRGEVGWVSDSDRELIGSLEEEGYESALVFRSYEWDLATELPTRPPPQGFEVRPLRGESEANSRRAAAHAAFESTMPSAMHLQRYLDFMRSPVYAPQNDLVAVDSEGNVASFMIWWGDHRSRIAQIEPFGTHPAFHRRGIGRWLLYEGLAAMKRAGMRVVRVCTEDDRPATAFYEKAGFRDVGRLRWWRLP